MTTRKRVSREAKKHLAPKVIEAYRRLKELEAMNLPSDDPRMCGGGEHGHLVHLVNKALGLRPWTTELSDEQRRNYEELREAAGFEPRNQK